MAGSFAPLTGGCQCGDIRFEILALPTDAYYCHCRICQRAGGAPVNATARFPTDAFRLLRGEPAFYGALEYGERGFCRRCGSPLYYRTFAEGWKESVFVRIASLDAPDRVVPEWHCGVESQLPWFRTDDDLPRRTSEENLDRLLGPNVERRPPPDRPS